MAEMLTEALLEMHFFRAQVQHFENLYGANFLKILKPSPKREAWVGFDQGWAYTSLTTGELLNHLKGAIQSQASSVNYFYLGYFLQFKTVQMIKRKRKDIPKNYPIPYFRSELSLKPNKTTRLSQHETLLRLNQVNFTSVCYASAMLFESEDLYKPTDLNRLRCVDISTSPSGWATNQPHFITFKTWDDQNPLWCSDPTEGKAIGFKEWASPDFQLGPKKLSREELLEVITTAYKEIRERRLIPKGFFSKPDFNTRYLPESFTIIEFQENVLDKDKIRKIRVLKK